MARAVHSGVVVTKTSLGATLEAQVFELLEAEARDVDGPHTLRTLATALGVHASDVVACLSSFEKLRGFTVDGRIVNGVAIRTAWNTLQSASMQIYLGPQRVFSRRRRASYERLKATPQPRHSAPHLSRRGARPDLVEALEAELKRLRGLPPHARLGVAIDARPERIAGAYQRAALKYHPARYAHLSAQVRLTADAVFTLFKTARASLTSHASRASSQVPKPEREPPPPSDSWRALPPRRHDSRPDERWVPNAADFADCAPAASADIARGAARAGESDVDEDGRPDPPSGARHAIQDPYANERKAALSALASGRLRDAKNLIARLLERMADDHAAAHADSARDDGEGEAADAPPLEVDTELLLADKLARGFLLWEEKRREEARDVLREALVLEPECSEAQSALEEIERELGEASLGFVRRFFRKR